METIFVSQKTYSDIASKFTSVEIDQTSTGGRKFLLCESGLIVVVVDQVKDDAKTVSGAL